MNRVSPSPALRAPSPPPGEKEGVRGHVGSWEKVPSVSSVSSVVHSSRLAFRFAHPLAQAVAEVLLEVGVKVLQAPWPAEAGVPANLKTALQIIGAVPTVRLQGERLEVA